MADELSRQRDLLFEAIQRLGGFYDSPEAQQLLGQFQDRAGGADAPFTPDVVNYQLGQNSAGVSGQYGTEQEMINRAFANAGLTGSGLQTNALINARSRAAHRVREGRRSITSRAELQNYQARAAAQNELAQFLQQQQANAQAATVLETDARSKLHATGDANNVAQVTTPNQSNSNTPQAPAAAPAPAPAAPAAPMPKLFQRPLPSNAWSGNFSPGSAHQAMSQAQYLNDVENIRMENERHQQEYQARLSAWLMNQG